MDSSVDTACIVLVEDDPDIQEAVRDMLTAAGYTITVANNGREALAHLKDTERLPCLVIMDVFMPEMNGYELLKLLRSQDRFVTLPVAVCSASDDPPPGAARYLKKPFELASLIGVVESFCQRHRRIAAAEPGTHAG
jgi:DNA-binding response OmpR family regulator